MSPLSDPRIIAPRPYPELLATVAEDVTTSKNDLDAIVARMRRLLEAGDDRPLRDLLAWNGPPALCQIARRCLQAAVDGDIDAPLRGQIFVLPVLILAGSRILAQVPMIVGDMCRIQDVFTAAGCLGPSVHFALNAALCDASTLRALSPVDLYRRARFQGESDQSLDLPELALGVQAGQSVHLRFICGTTIVTRGAPGFQETAGEAGRWGAALTRELASQLAYPGVTLLPIARPPKGIYTGLGIGYYCREEMDFQASVGTYLSDMRARAGDPKVRVFTSGDRDVNIELTSAWGGDARVHVWRLAPDDDFQEVMASILGFLRECGLTDIALRTAGDGRPS